ncbi:TPA: hypothetical protein ACHFZX_002678 [Escherichia coli]
MTITKQRVEEIISRIEMYGHGAGYTAEEVYDLAVLALNLSNIANLKRYELDMGGCDSCGQDCGADMTEDSDGDYPKRDDSSRRIDVPYGGYEIKTITHPHFGDKPVKVFAIKVNIDD